MSPQEMVLILFILVLCDAVMLLYLIDVALQFVSLNILKNMLKPLTLIFTMCFYVTFKLRD